MKIGMFVALLLAFAAPALGQGGEGVTFTESLTVRVFDADGRPFFGSGGGGGVSVVSTPEPALLRRMLPRHVYGRELAAAVNPGLQRATARVVARLLGGEQRGTTVALPNLRLEVEPWCSGLVLMKWLTVLALGLAFVGRGRWSWRLALVLAAPLVAFEANALRVAGIGAVAELGYNPWPWKEWLGWGGAAFGVAQVIGLRVFVGRVAS